MWNLMRMRQILSHPYARFVMKKAIFYLGVTFIALTLIFLIPRLMPGNPIDMMIHPGTSNPFSGIDFEEIRAVYEAYYGLDRPLLDQYVTFWVQLFQGDLGRSFMWFPQEVSDIVFRRLPSTLVLVLPVLFLSFYIGNWIGARAAHMKGRKSEATYFISIFSNRMPVFWFGMVLLFLLAVQIPLFPLFGNFSQGLTPSFTLRFFFDVLHHFALPFITLMIVYTGGWATGMRAMMIHEMDSGYVRYGRQLGFKEERLMSYSKRNAILPQLTGLNLYFNTLVGETLILEVIFGWQGIGRLLYDAVMNVDYPLLLGGFIDTIIIVILGNFLIDILYGIIDPRIRTGHR